MHNFSRQDVTVDKGVADMQTEDEQVKFLGDLVTSKVTKRIHRFVGAECPSKSTGSLVGADPGVSAMFPLVQQAAFREMDAPKRRRF